MRPFHWAKIPDAKSVGTIWLEEDMDVDDKEEKFDADELEAVFSLAQKLTSTAGGACATVASKMAKKEQVQLIDMKRSNNIGIALARIRLDDEAIKAAVLDPVGQRARGDTA